ncbi:MAG: cysteine--tRNA ligase [Bacteroidales bacterium]
MLHQFSIYNTLSRKKELFEPVNHPYVGLYVCGPTVYSEPHLGHVRMAITFDILYRYLLFLGYKVRYVRNITDVGHLEDEISGEGEDKIAKKARLEQLEPMEIVQKYKNAFQQALAILNTLPPSIEPTASGHIIEQQQMIKKILDNGFAYERNGSVYFDIDKYNLNHTYGILSGRKTEELLANTRTLEGQDEKHSPLDFALWKKASPAHLMHWPSEWGEGFPGWHLECSAMGTKYLGQTFDIHGGGMDLMFPHHECEIAQSVAANGKTHVKYWMHNNMITINGQKMARSLKNFITLNELFTGTHPKLTKAYSPMAIRFFVLQAHYRSTLDFSDDALQAAEKGFFRLMRGIQTLGNLKAAEKSSADVGAIEQNCFKALDDDLNYSLALSFLFEGITLINSVSDGKESLSDSDIKKLQKLYNDMVFVIFGLKNEAREGESDSRLTSGLMELILNFRNEAKLRKDFSTSDKIREQLTKMGVSIKDTKDGTEWELI